MKKLLKIFWPQLAAVSTWGLLLLALVTASRCISHHLSTSQRLNPSTSQPLTPSTPPPLIRDTIHDTVEVVTQQVITVEKVKEAISDNDKQLLKDIGTSLSAVESYQKIGTITEAAVTLTPSTPHPLRSARSDASLAKNLSTSQRLNVSTPPRLTPSTIHDFACPAALPPGSPQPSQDSVLVYHDAWLDFKYNTFSQLLSFQLRDSLAIAVEKEYKHRFLWWRWKTKGYRVKVANFNPHSTVTYNQYIRKIP